MVHVRAISGLSMMRVAMCCILLVCTWSLGLCCPCCPSRSLHLAALAAAHPPCSSPGPTPTPRTFVAPAGCSPGSKLPVGPACGLPVGCLLPQRCLLLELCSLCTSGGRMCSGPAAAATSLLGLRSVQHALGGRVGSMPHQGDGRWRAVCLALWQCRATASVVNHARMCG